MKKVLTFLFAVVTCGIQAQWQTNYDEALALAKNENKPIVLVFSGSDWCGPCIRLKKTILDTDAFSEYALENYVLYNADFPRKKKNQLDDDLLSQNKTLFAEYNPKGYFPLVVVLDEQQNVLGKTGYNRRNSVQDYISLIDGFVE